MYRLDEKDLVKEGLNLDLMEGVNGIYSVSIIMPALNEGGVVGRTVRSIDVDALEKMGLSVEIIVVDNGSDDNTGMEAEEAGARVVFEKRRGYGSAYLRGLKEVRGDIIVMGDADGTYPLYNISEFIEPLFNGADFVIGSRINGEIHDGAMPRLHRHIGNPLLTGAMNFLFKTSISDAHCGMRAFTKEALSKMRLQTTGMEFATEMIVEAARRDLKIVEKPIEYHPRGGGEAKLNSFNDGWRHLRFMMLFSPDYLFFLPGTVLSTLGVVLMSLLLRGPIKLGGVSLDIHPMVLGALLTLLGFQILISGVITKQYAISEGYATKGGLISSIQKHFTLEKGIMIGLLLFLFGFFINGNIIYAWYSSGFGSLPTLKWAIFAAIFMVIGIQSVFSAFFLSMMGIKRDYGEHMAKNINKEMY